MKTEKLFENQRKHQRQIMFDSDYEYDNPFGWNGNINSIVYRRYCADRYYCDGIHWEEIDRSEIKFNEFGEIQNLTRHHLGKLINKTRNKYDKAGRLIVQESIDEPGRLFVAYNYKYDSSDKLIEKIIKNKKSLLFKYLYTYDEHGRLIQKFSHCLVGGGKFWTTYLYNEEGNIAMQAEILLDGSIGKMQMYSYDKRGNIEHSLLKESFESFTYYEYDSDGKINKKVAESHGIETDSEESSNESTKIWYEEFEYDNNGNVITAAEREGSDIVYRHEWIIKYRKQ